MISTKQTIVEFARSLYMEVDSEGKKIHTWRSISTLIQKKFKKEVNYSTVAKWATKYDWESTFEKIKMAGIERSKSEMQDKEKELIDEKSAVIADIYKSNKNIQRLSQQVILSRLTGKELKDSAGNIVSTDISNADLIRLLQHSEQSLLELHDKKKPQDQENNFKVTFK